MASLFIYAALSAFWLHSSAIINAAIGQVLGCNCVAFPLAYREAPWRDIGAYCICRHSINSPPR
jgi:hypothetical protein